MHKTNSKSRLKKDPTQETSEPQRREFLAAAGKLAAVAAALGISHTVMLGSAPTTYASAAE